MKNYFTFTKPLFFFIMLFVVAFHSAAAQEIGLQMGSMRKMMSQGMPAVLVKVKEMGITELEGGAGRTDRATFKKLLKEYGLKIVATGGSFDRISNKDTIQKVIANAKDLGAKFVVCYWIPHDGDNFTFQDMKKGVEVFNAAGKTLKENGLTLAYHPHGYEFRPYEGGGNSTLFEYMMNNTKQEYVSFQMDVFWIKHPGQDPVALLKKYPSRFLLMHLKDRKPGTPGNENGQADLETNVVLGTGDVGIAEIMKTAKRTGVKHFFIEDESSRSEQQIPVSLAVLRGLK